MKPMDPKLNLMEQLELARRIQDTVYSDDYQGSAKVLAIAAAQLAALVLGLNEWLSNRGMPW